MILPKVTALSDSHLAELGRIVAQFAILENTVIASIRGFLKCSKEECLMLCSERSFRNLLDLAGSLAKQSLGKRRPQLHAFESMLGRAQELECKRNAYMHSLYGASCIDVAVRTKVTARRKDGLRMTREELTPDVIRSTAMKMAVLSAEMETFLVRNRLRKGWI